MLLVIVQHFFRLDVVSIRMTDKTKQNKSLNRTKQYTFEPHQKNVLSSLANFHFHLNRHKFRCECNTMCFIIINENENKITQ